MSTALASQGIFSKRADFRHLPNGAVLADDYEQCGGKYFQRHEVDHPHL
jgi:hypothetical protein